MDSKEFDINEEYEKTFGSTPRKMLFGDEEYTMLRKEICQANVATPQSLIEKIQNLKNTNQEYLIPSTIDKQWEHVKENCPFEGVDVVPYKVFIFNTEIIPSAQKNWKLFFVKRVVNGRAVALAAAHYNAYYNKFIVIKGSYFKSNAYSKTLIDFNQELLSNAFDCDGDIYYANANRNYVSAALAASIFLGKSAKSEAWVSKKGQKLDQVYSIFSDPNTIENDRTFFPGYVPPIKKDSKPTERKDIISLLDKILGKIISPEDNASPKKETPLPTSIKKNSRDSILNKLSIKADTADTTNNEINWSNHLFYIKIGIKEGSLIASGIFDPDDKSLTLLAKSWLSIKESPLFQYSLYGKMRDSVISNKCDTFKYGYHLRDNLKCVSPTVAASIILGHEVDGNTVWKDKDGCQLITLAHKNGINL